MNDLLKIVRNEPLVIAATAWIVAGILKTIIDFIVNKKLSLSRIMGAGGMPSSHTSTVVALMIAVAHRDGVSGSTFAIAVIFMIIVIHDAIGVRLETGKQAQVLNKMIFESETFKDLDFEKKLKEYVGHTPSQALVGAIVGIIVATLMISFVYK